MNYDEATLAQVEKIQKEVAEVTGLVLAAALSYNYLSVD
jgi:hypothetical protein